MTDQFRSSKRPNLKSLQDYIDAHSVKSPRKGKKKTSFTKLPRKNGVKSEKNSTDSAVNSSMRMEINAPSGETSIHITPKDELGRSSGTRIISLPSARVTIDIVTTTPPMPTKWDI